MSASSKKILFVVTEDWYFCSHRMPLAIAAIRAGFQVAVATRVTKHQKIIEESGIRVIPLSWMRRSSLNPIRELFALWELIFLYRRERPDLVHQVALKPAIFGSLAARLTGVPGRVSALGGLGFIFSSTRVWARLLRSLILPLFRVAFNHQRSRLILQNRDDQSVMVDAVGIDPRFIRLIRGAGVDMNQYQLTRPAVGQPIVLLAARMLWDKGVNEFVDAARLLRQKEVSIRFVLVGEPDIENPLSLSQAQLQAWHDSGEVEWWGYREDMSFVLGQASVICLPSYYGEGIPKELIEAMACGRAIITTDMPGCRDTIFNDANGILIPPRDAHALARAIETLINDKAKREAMGLAGRRIAEERYALPLIVAETISVYTELDSCQGH